MPVASAAAPAEAQLDELIPKIGMLILGARMPDMDHEAEHTPSRNRRVPDAATDGREVRKASARPMLGAHVRSGHAC